MVEEIESFHVNDTWELTELPKERRPLDANEFLQKRMDLQVVLCITKSD